MIDNIDRCLGYLHAGADPDRILLSRILLSMTSRFVDEHEKLIDRSGIAARLTSTTFTRAGLQRTSHASPCQRAAD